MRAHYRRLAAQTDQADGLPTGSEWEAAARGPDGPACAYRDTLDRSRANTLETHLRATLPVVVFPTGDGPSRAADRTGNVKEWLADVATERGQGAVHSVRPARGGSWNLDSAVACSSVGEKHLPELRAYDIGLRVIVS